MNADAVRGLVVKRTKGTWLENAKFVDTFIELLSEHETLHLGSLNALIDAVKISTPPDVSKSQLQDELAPKNLLYSYFLLDKLSLSVKAIRRGIFKSIDAPFKTIEEATNWIEQEGQNKPSNFEEANKLVNKLQEMTHWTVSCKVLPYIGGDGWQRIIVVWAGTLSERLADETKELAEATGFNQASLVMHILTGIKPLLPLAQIVTHISNFNAPSGETFLSHRVELKITARDLSTSQLSQIYKEMRGKLGVESDRHIKEDDFKLYETVRILGYPPEQNKTSRSRKRAKGTVDFWKTVQKEFEKGEKQGKRKTWNAYRVAYHRLLRKLENTGITEVEQGGTG